jgi:hypothetical protein
MVQTSEIPPPRCALATAGCCDGLGHRLESVFSCIAVSHELGFQYVHEPFVFKRGHGNAQPRASAHDSLFALDRHFPLLAKPMRVHRLQTLLTTGTCYRHVANTKVVSTLGANQAGRSGWFERVAAARNNASATGGCVADGRTVYRIDNCWEWFWCTTVPQGAHAWWRGTIEPRQQTGVCQLCCVTFWNVVTGTACCRLCGRRCEVCSRHRRRRAMQAAAAPTQAGLSRRRRTACGPARSWWRCTSAAATLTGARCPMSTAHNRAPVALCRIAAS